MIAKCENCGQERELPAYLWRQVIYWYKGLELEGEKFGRTKTVCPACYEWAKNHPDDAEVVQGQ